MHARNGHPPPKEISACFSALFFQKSHDSFLRLDLVARSFASADFLPVTAGRGQSCDRHRLMETEQNIAVSLFSHPVFSKWLPLAWRTTMRFSGSEMGPGSSPCQKSASWTVSYRVPERAKGISRSIGLKARTCVVPLNVESRALRYFDEQYFQRAFSWTINFER